MTHKSDPILVTLALEENARIPIFLTLLILGHATVDGFVRKIFGSNIEKKKNLYFVYMRV